MSDEAPAVVSPAKPKLADRLKRLFDEYGSIAIGVYLSLSVLFFVGFFIAIRMGFSLDSAAGTATTAGAAWIGLKMTMPIRIPIALVLTPFAAKLWRRVRPPVVTPD